MEKTFLDKYWRFLEEGKKEFWGRGYLNILIALGTNEVVDFLIQELPEDPEKKVRAANSLRKDTASELGPLILEPLIHVFLENLENQERSVREEAAKALGDFQFERAEDGLLQTLMKDPDCEVRRAAVWALGQIKSERAVESLIQILLEKPSSLTLLIREKAADALGTIGSERAVESLIRILKDKYWEVRSAGAGALGKMKSEHVVEPLIQALRDPESDVQQEAAEALGKIKSERAVEPLIQVFWQNPMGIGRYEVRRKAAEALMKIKSERALDVLHEDALFQACLMKFDKFSGWKRHEDDIPAEVLGRIGSERSVDALILALKDEDEYVRWMAARALSVIKSERSADALILALKDEDKMVRWMAFHALAGIKLERAAEPMAQAFLEQYPLFIGLPSSAIVWCLSKSKSERAVDALLQFLALRQHEDKVREILAELFVITVAKGKPMWYLLEKASTDRFLLGDIKRQLMEKLGIRNPDAWIAYHPPYEGPYLYSTVDRLLTSAEEELFKNSPCCSASSSREFIRILDRNTKDLIAVHAVHCPQVREAYWQRPDQS